MSPNNDNIEVLYSVLFWGRLWRQRLLQVDECETPAVWVLHGDPQVLRAREGLQPLLIPPVGPEET